MAYAGDPVDSKTDELRLIIGDTSSPYELTDAEIEYFLSKRSNIYYAGFDACEAIAAHYSNLTDLNSGGLSDTGSQKAKAWHDKASKLYEMATTKRSITGPVTSTGHMCPPTFHRGQFRERYY